MLMGVRGKLIKDVASACGYQRATPDWLRLSTAGSVVTAQAINNQTFTQGKEEFEEYLSL